MKIDNKKNIYRIWLRKMILTISFTISVITILFIIPDTKSDLPLTRYHIVIAISAIFILVSIVGIWRNPYYFYFNDTNDVLVFKYYPVGLFNSRKNSVQIPKQHFVKFETSKFFFGMEEKLVLYQLYRKKIAKYPSISLSALSREDQKKLKLLLEKYVAK